MKQCNDWKDNKEVFGCNDKDMKPEVESLCNNPVIKAGTHESDNNEDGSTPSIYVFRGGKYWKFNNKPAPTKPFGDLVEGAKSAEDKWPGIHIPGGAGFENSNFIMIYKTRWSRWTPNKTKGSEGKQDKNPDDSDGSEDDSNGGPKGGKGKPSGSNQDGDQDRSDGEPTGSSGGKGNPSGSNNKSPVVNIDTNEIKDTFEEAIQDEDEAQSPDSIYSFDKGSDIDKGAGALINVEPNKGRYAKVSGDQICYFVIKNKMCFRSGKCTSVTEDKNNFPPNILAAFKARDKNWYFINKNGKYCKRADNSFNEVIEKQNILT
jgi:hypothetical protein